MLRLDRGESQAKRLTQQIQELQDTVNVVQDVEDLKDRELATGEVSGQTCTCVFDRHDVSEAKSTVGRNVGNPPSRDPWESPTLSNTSVMMPEGKGKGKREERQ